MPRRPPLTPLIRPRPPHTPTRTLKYRGSFPVLNRARLISKPRLHLYASHGELHGLLHGKSIKRHRGLGAGEVLVVRTPQGRYLEGWEALAEGTGGEVLAAFG
jgi:ribosomal protein S8